MPKNSALQKAGSDKTKSGSKKKGPDPFETLYPSLAEWIKNRGLLEIGYNDFSYSFVRVLDVGGIFWEGKNQYKSIDAALRAVDRAAAKFIKENGGTYT